MNDRGLLVGAAVGNTTPTGELPNYAGTLHRRGDADSDLLCHALFLSDGDTEVVLAACDATFIDRPLLLRIRDECQRKVGIPGSNVWVAATHTHSAPAVAPSFLEGALPDPLYLDFFIDRVAGAIVDARQSAKPALVVAGTARAPKFELNRRTIRPDGGVMVQQWDRDYPVEGPVDPRVGFLGFEGADGEPIAILVEYAVHNNCCYGEMYHRDLFGRCGDALRARFPCLRAVPFVAGAAGNIVWGDPDALEMRRGDAQARLVGKRCAERISEAYRQAPRSHVSELQLSSRVLELPDRPLSESTFCHDGCRGTTEAALRGARQRYDPEEKAVRERGDTTCPVEIAALSLGEAAIATNAAELFVEYGLDIKRESPFETTLVATLANGYCGYVPTEKAFQHGGYETHRTVYTSRLVVDAGKQIVQASLDLLQELHEAKTLKV